MANLISDSIEPRLLPEIEILLWRRKHLLGVQIYPSPSRPHFIAREGIAAGAYLRVGSSNRRADEFGRRIGEHLGNTRIGDCVLDQYATPVGRRPRTRGRTCVP